MLLHFSISEMFQDPTVKTALVALVALVGAIAGFVARHWLGISKKV